MTATLPHITDSPAAVETEQELQQVVICITLAVRESRHGTQPSKRNRSRQTFCSIATRTDQHTTSADTSRIFTTELVNSGLPIHIGATLLGHLNIQTTRGYVKARELHQTGAKSQVTCSRRRPDGPQRYYELAF
jgi:hypothetical protein